MHTKISTQPVFFLCLLGLLTISQSSLEAVTPPQKVASVQVIPGQGGGFPHPPQLVVSLDQAAQSLKLAGSGNSKFLLIDTNGDGRADSIVSTPQGATGVVSLDQAVSILKGVGGASKSYMAVDANQDGKTDFIVAVTY
jgi:hypothetical protein